MTKIVDACRYVRSKNAGPFWITVDLFFRDRAHFDRYARSPALTCAALAPIFGARPDAIRRFEVADLLVLKFSYPRDVPQGGVIERDMHGGQQYVDLLDVELDPAL